MIKVMIKVIKVFTILVICLIYCSVFGQDSSQDSLQDSLVVVWNQPDYSDEDNKDITDFLLYEMTLDSLEIIALLATIPRGTHNTIIPYKKDKQRHLFAIVAKNKYGAMSGFGFSNILNWVPPKTPTGCLFLPIKIGEVKR